MRSGCCCSEVVLDYLRNVNNVEYFWQIYFLKVWRIVVSAHRHSADCRSLGY